MTRTTFFRLIKIPIAMALLAYVLQQADLLRIGEIFSQVHLGWLFIAFGCFTLAQLVSVLRLNAYYRWHAQPLSFGFSWRMHYVALLYNIIIPGGIGGDGYRIYLLKKQADYSAKTGIKIQLLSRLNGLLVIGLSILVLVAFMPLPNVSSWLLPTVVAMAVLCVFFYLLVIPFVFKTARRQECRAFIYSALIHAMNLACVAALYVGLAGDSTVLVFYLLLFQIALVAGMIPITIGGLGLRELVFFYGASYWNTMQTMPVDAELGVALSLLVFAITLISSLGGFFWVSQIEKMKPCVEMPNRE